MSDAGTNEAQATAKPRTKKQTAKQPSKNTGKGKKKAASETTPKADKEAAEKSSAAAAAATNESSDGKTAKTENTADAASGSKPVQNNDPDTASHLRKSAFTLYSGVALSLAWFYCIWFVPQVYLKSTLLSWQITVAWLASLAISAAAMFLIPAALKGERHLSDNKFLIVAAPAVMTISGFIYTCGIATTNVAYCFILPAAMGIASALLWIQWGEYYATIRASYPIGQVALTVGAIVLASVLLTVLLPKPANTVFVSLLPLLSMWLLISVRTRAIKQDAHDYPRLLPQKERRKGLHNALIIGAITAVASASCYFTVAIIPVPDLVYEDYTFTVGVVWGAVLLLAIGVFCLVRPGRTNIFRVFPWLLVLTALAVMMYLTGDVDIYNTSFRLALMLSTVFEVLLLMYIGILSSKGYLSPALSFGFSGGFVRAGIVFGNGIAVIFEHSAVIQDALLLPVTLFFAFIPVALLIPLVRREYAITAMTAPIERKSDLEDQVEAVADEFSLSAREREVLLYLARGYTAEGIGKQLFISNFTAQTHIQHIYSKTGIHKRSDLIDYITKRSTSPNAAEESATIDKLPEYWPLPS